MWRTRSRSRINLSATSPRNPGLVLDENFPEPLVTAVLQVATPTMQLVSWKNVGASVSGRADADLISELANLGYGAIVTCDWHMLYNADVLAAMRQTNFTVIGCKDVGHDPIRATGLLLYNLEHIATHLRDDRPQPWLLASRQSSPRDFTKLIRETETKLGRKINL
jgi:PIN domain-containing protein